MTRVGRTSARRSVPRDMGGTKMLRSSALKVLNPILAVFFLNQVITGVFHKAIPYKTYEIFHQGGGILFALAALLHVILNWNWVKANFFKKKG